MNKIMYFADATCDLPQEFIKSRNIQLLGLRYAIGETEGWYTSANKEQLKEFYTKMRKGDTASTSLVLYDDAITAFEPFFKDGYDIIHFGLSSGLAKTYENALNAGNDLAKKYGRKFYAPDTKCVSAMNIFIIDKCMKLEKEYSDLADGFEKIAEELPKLYNRVQAYFTVENLKYLNKSGRLSDSAKLVGNFLNIKPIIICEKKEGKLVTYTKKLGRLTSIQYLSSIVANIDPSSNDIFIIHADCPNDAKMLEQKVRKRIKNAKIQVVELGFIIGTHTGPGTIGLGFIGK